MNPGEVTPSSQAEDLKCSDLSHSPSMNLVARHRDFLRGGQHQGKEESTDVSSHGQTDLSGGKGVSALLTFWHILSVDSAQKKKKKLRNF